MEVVVESKLISYKERILTGGLRSVVEVYSELYAQGYGYAGWARGVALGDSITGQSALGFLTNSAAAGAGGLGCRMVSVEFLDGIRVDMALGYLDALIGISKDNNGAVYRDVKFAEVRQFHERAFIQNGLDIKVWTLDAPMEFIRRESGSQAAHLTFCPHRLKSTLPRSAALPSRPPTPSIRSSPASTTGAT